MDLHVLFLLNLEDRRLICLEVKADVDRVMLLVTNHFDACNSSAPKRDSRDVTTIFHRFPDKFSTRLS
jgi:hypothetical protein